MHTIVLEERPKSRGPNPRPRDAAFWREQDDNKTKIFYRLVAGFKDVKRNPNCVFVGREDKDVMDIVEAIKENKRNKEDRVYDLGSLILKVGLQPLRPSFGGMRPGGPKPV